MSTTSTETRQPVSTQLVILVLGVALILVGLILGLVYLAGPDGRSDVLQWLTGIASLIGGGAASTALVQLRGVKQVTSKIDQQTNGVLDQRIEAGVSKVMADHGFTPVQTGIATGGSASPVPPGQVRGYVAE